MECHALEPYQLPQSAHIVSYWKNAYTAVACTVLLAYGKFFLHHIEHLRADDCPLHSITGLCLVLLHLFLQKVHCNFFKRGVHSLFGEFFQFKNITNHIFQNIISDRNVSTISATMPCSDFCAVL